MVAGALLLGVTGIMSGCTGKTPGFSAIDVTGADYARDFSLTDHNGQPRTLADFKGKQAVVIAWFIVACVPATFAITRFCLGLLALTAMPATSSSPSSICLILDCPRNGLRYFTWCN